MTSKPAPETLRESTPVEAIAWPWIALAVVIAVSVAGPTCSLGFMADDWEHRFALEHASLAHPLLQLFTFMDGDPEHMQRARALGWQPWFAADELRISFMRPLSAALILVDDALFGANARLHHLHSLAWYAGLVAVWGLLLRKILPPPIATIALLAFALDESHWQNVAWIACRNSLVSTTLGLLGVAMYLRARDSSRAVHAILASICFAAALLAGESALGVLAYVLAYECVGNDDPLRARLVRIGPLTALFALWALLHVMGGYGTYASGGYLDPLREPWAYVVALPERLLVLLAVQFLGVPGDAWTTWPHVREWILGAGVAALAMLAWLLPPAWRAQPAHVRRTLAWLTLGGALSTLPLAAGLVSARLLLVPSLAANVLTALVIVTGFRVWRLHAAERWATRLRWWASVTTLLGQLVFAWVPWWLTTSIIDDVFVALERMAHERDALVPPSFDGTIVLLTSPGFVEAGYLARTWQLEHGLHAKRWLMLSHATFDHVITRTHANALELEVVHGWMLDSDFERLYRGSRFALQSGASVDLGDVNTRDAMRIHVVSANEGKLARIRFSAEQDLDTDGLLWMAWHDGKLQRIELPPVSQRKQLDFQPGPAQPEW